MWITSASWVFVTSCVTTEHEVASVLAPIIVVTDPASAERVEPDTEKAADAPVTPESTNESTH